MVRARPGSASIHCSGTHPRSSHCTRRFWFAARRGDSPTSQTIGPRIAVRPCGQLLDLLALRIRMWLELQGPAGIMRTLWRTLWRRREIEDLLFYLIQKKNWILKEKKLLWMDNIIIGTFIVIHRSKGLSYHSTTVNLIVILVNYRF